MKKGVLFDFWGTLVDNKLKPSPTKQAKQILGIEIPFGEYIVPFEEAFMTEEVKGLYEGFEKVAEEFGIDADQEVLDELVGMWNKSYILAEPYPETMEVLEALADDYKIGLVSNSPPSMKRVLEKFGLEKFFDAIILSSEVGALKTHEEMFERVLEELGLSKEDVIMVGDSIHSDMKGAENAGVTGVLIDRRDTREYKNKITNLKEVKDYLEG